MRSDALRRVHAQLHPQSEQIDPKGERFADTVQRFNRNSSRIAAPWASAPSEIAMRDVEIDEPRLVNIDFTQVLPSSGSLAQLQALMSQLC